MRAGGVVRAGVVCWCSAIYAGWAWNALYGLLRGVWVCACVCVWFGCGRLLEGLLTRVSFGVSCRVSVWRAGGGVVAACGRLPWGLRIVLGWRERRMLCKRFWRAFMGGVACAGMFGLKVSQIAS